MVIKPSPTTPVTTVMLGQIIKDIVPAGVVNILVDNNDLGPLLTTHPDVDKISFTGSTPTGKRIMASSADTLKRLTLELGGNDAAIVLDDVDPKAQAENLFGCAFMNSGQVCVAPLLPAAPAPRPPTLPPPLAAAHRGHRPVGTPRRQVSSFSQRWLLDPEL